MPAIVHHVALTVRDIDAATDFFREVLGATIEADLVTEPLAGPDVETGLGLPPSSTVLRVRRLTLGGGADLELFEIDAAHQADPPRVSDLGIQHFAVEVDEMDETIRLAAVAGGRMLASPAPVPGGDATMLWAYCRLPWGGVMELLSQAS
ncbi:VOC family protein [Streptomyces sp. NPDC003393]